MDEQTAHNLAQQATLYGRPLGDVVRDLTQSLGLTQARLAEVLGMSAPMLSQLATGRRVKIGNPLAVARLQSLLELSRSAHDLTSEQLAAELDRVHDATSTITTSSTSPVVAQLAQAGSVAALQAAAAAADPLSPGLAVLLREAADVARHG